MTRQEFATVKRLWKAMFAISAFRSAIAAIDLIVREKMDGNDKVYNALIAAVFTQYARPFTANNGVGPLNPKIIPKHLRPLHGQLMTFRHQMFAHSNPKAFKIDRLGPVIQAWFNFDANGGMANWTTGISFSVQKIMALKGCLEEILTAVLKEYSALIESLKQHTPSAFGDYVLNVYDADRPVWIRHSEAKQLLPADAIELKIVKQPSDR